MFRNDGLVRELLGLAIAASSLSSAFAVEPPKYQIVKLVDHAAVGAVSSVAYDVNESLQVVGSYFTGTQVFPFSWSNGVMTPLSIAPGDVGGSAHGINNAGWIVGYTYDLTGFTRPTMWRGTERIDFSVVAPGLFASEAAIYAVNDAGVFAATLGASGGLGLSYNSANGDAWILADRDSQFQSARAINSHGWVVGIGGGASSGNGNAALLARDFRIEELPSTQGRGGSWANDINDLGVAVGTQVGSSTLCPTKWESGGEEVFFCSGEGEAFGINNRGAIVGQLSFQEGGFLRLGSRTYVLSTLIDPTDPLNGSVLPLLGRDINESMAVVGVGRDEVGATFAMALIPVPEPSTCLLIAVGLMAVLVSARRQRPSE